VMFLPAVCGRNGWHSRRFVGDSLADWFLSAKGDVKSGCGVEGPGMWCFSGPGGYRVDQKIFCTH